jgi:thiol-disulfide isomerase/thioredoxin
VLRRLTGLAAALLAGTLLHAGAVREVPSPATGRVFALDLAGKPVDPFEIASGKPVVFIFVRTDCPISNRYAPTIQALSRKYASEALLVLVYPDKSETPTAIEKHLHEYGYKNEALLDTRHNLVKLSQVEITPEAAVFNARANLFTTDESIIGTKSLATRAALPPPTNLTTRLRQR